jgi:hypothetical protein
MTHVLKWYCLNVVFDGNDAAIAAVMARTARRQDLIILVIKRMLQVVDIHNSLFLARDAAMWDEETGVNWVMDGRKGHRSIAPSFICQIGPNVALDTVENVAEDIRYVSPDTACGIRIVSPQTS